MNLLVDPQLLLSCLERLENRAHNVIDDRMRVELPSDCSEVLSELRERHLKMPSSF